MSPFSTLPPLLAEALTTRGYEAPTPVQASVQASVQNTPPCVINIIADRIEALPMAVQAGRSRDFH